MGSLSRKIASLWLVFPCVRLRMRSQLRLINNPILLFLFPFLPFVSLPYRSRVCILSGPIRPSPPPPRPLVPHPLVLSLPPSSTWSAPPPLLRHPHLNVPHSSSPVMTFFFRVVFSQLYLHRTLLVSCGDGRVRHRCVGWSLQCLIDATIALWTHCPFSAVLGLFPPARPLCYPPPLPNTLVPRTSGLVVVCLPSLSFVYPPAHHPFLFPLASLRPPTFALPNVIWLA